jgi:hypothetical protein
MSDQEIITIKQYIDTRFNDLNEKLQERFKLTDAALLNADKSLQNRLEQLNEFRAQILEERNLYARKDDMNLQLDTLREKVIFAGGKTAGKEYMIGLFVAIGLGVAALVVNLLT